MRNRRFIPQRNKPLHRINRFIRSDSVRLVDENGEQRGVVPLRDALMMAERAGLDLVEVAPNADPPVCKIEDYRKVLYEKKKRDKAAKKRHKTIEMKEIPVRPNIDIHDFEIKMNKAIEFLQAGKKVKIIMRFRGREIATADKRGRELREKVLHYLGAYAQEESFSRQSARNSIMVLAPREDAKKPKQAKAGAGLSKNAAKNAAKAAAEKAGAEAGSEKPSGKGVSLLEGVEMDPGPDDEDDGTDNDIEDDDSDDGDDIEDDGGDDDGDDDDNDGDDDEDGDDA